MEIAATHDGEFDPRMMIPRGIILMHVGMAATFFLTIFAAVLALLKVRYPGAKELYGVRPGTWALKTTNLIHHVTSSTWAMYIILQDPVLPKILTFRGGVDEARAMMSCSTSLGSPVESYSMLVPYSIGYMVYDLVCFGLWSKDPETVVFIAHHVFSMYGWAEGLHFDWGSRHTLFLISTELTGIFNLLRWMLSQVHLKATVAYAVNGTIFTMLFILVRVIPAPALFLSMMRHPPYQEPAHCISTYCRYATCVGIVFLFIPHALNLYWASKVISGYRKSLQAWFGKSKTK